MANSLPGYTLETNKQCSASHAYIGYGIVLEKAAVLAAIRSDPDYIAMVRKGGLVENYDLSDDESAWRFAIAYVGETRRFNKEHGTGLEEHNVNDNMYIFDCPMDAIHDDEVCEFVAIIDEKATRVVDPEVFRLYLEEMGIVQEVTPKLYVIAY